MDAHWELAGGLCCTHRGIITDGNNSPGAKLGINFDGNRSLMAWLWRPWLVIGSDVFGQGIVTTRDCSKSPIQPHVIRGMVDRWDLGAREVVVIFGYLAV